MNKESAPIYISILGDDVTFWKNSLGLIHRTDGPARIWEYISGDITNEYYLNGEKYSKEEWFSLLTLEQKENYIWSMNAS